MTENKRRLIIAVDGPAASGKGALAKRLAEELDLVYLDTGRLYRYVGLKLLETVDDIANAEDHDSPEAAAAVEIARNLVWTDVANYDLVGEEVGRAASIISAIPLVRNALLSFQREVAHSPKGAVLDGRDIGTIVCPEADFKFYITANIETRAKRRYKELQNQGNKVIYSSTLEELQQRDERDIRRKRAPLRSAEGSIHIDTTDMSLEEVFEKALSCIAPS